MATRMTAARELGALIARLQKERQAHLDTIAQIDSVFAEFGIEPTAARGRRSRRKVGRPRKAKRRVGKKVAKRRKRRTRRSSNLSGPQSILNLVRRAGRKGIRGAEIVKHWNAEGRRGGAYTPISKLVNAGKLKRRALKGEKGSKYIIG